MRRELYYSLYDAECAADAWAQRNGGLVVGLSVEAYPLRGTILADDDIAYKDERFTRNMNEPWTELQAVRVVDELSLEDTALFGYYEDMID